MNNFVYLRPDSVAAAVALLQEHAEARLLAGGQSLLAAMKLGLNAPSHLIDLQDLPGLTDIRLHGNALTIGAMCCHAAIAASPVVQDFCPMLAELAHGIADQQVRQVGTIGGSLANNDPAACWPAGILALDATVVTNQREIEADDFFQGLFATVLRTDELIVAIRFGRPLAAHYVKYEQPASHFALVGVAVARFSTDAGGPVRVAITGLGSGVARWAAAEQALADHWSVTALNGLTLQVEHAQADIHASAAYRAHLAAVMCRRAVARLTREKLADRATTKTVSAPALSATPQGTHASAVEPKLKPQSAPSVKLPDTSSVTTKGLFAQLEQFLHRLFRR